MLPILFIIACGNTGPSSGYGTFDWELRGTWVSNDPSVYDGTLIIDYNTITIMGYFGFQTPPNGDDMQRPFKDFTKETALSAYTEGGFLFILDANEWQEGIPYIYYTTDYGRKKHLRFTFGGRQETLDMVYD